MKLKRAIENNEKIPKELKGDEAAVRREMALAGPQGLELKNSMDDEYQMAGIDDPKLFLTTSGDPSPRLIALAKEMKLLFPNCTRVNRGHLSLNSIVEMCRANNVTDMIILHETRGEPDGMIISHLPYGPTAYFALYNVVLRQDVRPKTKMSLAFPHLVFHNFSTTLGERVMNILKFLFPVPKDESPRTIAFYNENDFISFRHFKADVHHKEVDLDEQGPRFEMRLFRIRLGALDQPEAKSEWELRPYMNSAKRRKFLGI